MASRLQTLRPRVQPLRKQAARGWLATSTGTTTERGYGWAWQQARERVMARDCGLCQVCHVAGRVTLASAVDHIVPKSQGGSDDEANLQAICKACHALKTGRESHGMG